MRFVNNRAAVIAYISLTDRSGYEPRQAAEWWTWSNPIVVEDCSFQSNSNLKKSVIWGIVGNPESRSGASISQPMYGSSLLLSSLIRILFRRDYSRSGIHLIFEDGERNWNASYWRSLKFIQYIYKKSAANFCEWWDPSSTVFGHVPIFYETLDVTVRVHWREHHIDSMIKFLAAYPLTINVPPTLTIRCGSNFGILICTTVGGSRSRHDHVSHTHWKLDNANAESIFWGCVGCRVLHFFCECSSPIDAM